MRTIIFLFISIFIVLPAYGAPKFDYTECSISSENFKISLDDISNNGAVSEDDNKKELRKIYNIISPLIGKKPSLFEEGETTIWIRWETPNISIGSFENKKFYPTLDMDVKFFGISGVNIDLFEVVFKNSIRSKGRYELDNQIDGSSVYGTGYRITLCEKYQAEVVFNNETKAVAQPIEIVLSPYYGF